MSRNDEFNIRKQLTYKMRKSRRKRNRSMKQNNDVEYNRTSHVLKYFNKLHFNEKNWNWFFQIYFVSWRIKWSPVILLKNTSNLIWIFSLNFPSSMKISATIIHFHEENSLMPDNFSSFRIRFSGKIVWNLNFWE
jgi:hypothetical protein